MNGIGRAGERGERRQGAALNAKPKNSAGYLMSRGIGVFGFGATIFFLGFFTSRFPLSLLPMGYSLPQGDGQKL